MSDRDAKPGALYYGDCLEVMREWPDRFVDLCYLDPPFNSKADYNILFGGAAGADRQQTLAFTDTWHWDAAAAERTRALKRAGANVLDSIMIKSFSTEKLGYPTQKPLALLERIVGASSGTGDLVLGPFCGCGTTIAAADRPGRRWLGIDVSPFAIDLVKNRRMKSAAIEVRGVPVDVETARRMAAGKPFDFEKWAVTRVPGMTANSKQVGDGGIDGRGHLLAPPGGSSGLVLAQVKGGKFARSQLRDFLHTVRREGAALGVYITTDEVTSGGALAEAAARGISRWGRAATPRSSYGRSRTTSPGADRTCRRSPTRLPASRWSRTCSGIEADQRAASGRF